MATGTIHVELLHSAIGFDKTQKDTLRGLGLRKRHKVVELKDTPSSRGQIYKVRHLVRVLEKAPKAPYSWKGAVITPGAGPKAEKKAKAPKAEGKGKKKKATKAKGKGK